MKPPFIRWFFDRFLPYLKFFSRASMFNRLALSNASHFSIYFTTFLPKHNSLKTVFTFFLRLLVLRKLKCRFLELKVKSHSQRDRRKRHLMSYIRLGSPLYNCRRMATVRFSLDIKPQEYMLPSSIYVVAV